MFKELLLFALVQILVKSDKGKIIGGFLAKEGQFPYSASLKHFRSRHHFCGAVIVTKNWLLTAAHCVKWKDPSTFIVYVGSMYLDRWGRNHYVEKKVLHHKFGDINRFRNDIAMIKIADEMDFNENSQPIHLPINITVKSGAMATSIGWGADSFPNGRYSNQLQYYTREIKGSGYCRKYFDQIISEAQICFGGDLGHGACFSDSGSPLIYEASNITYAIGVVTAGVPCGAGYPDVYANVSYFLPWILKVLGSD